MTSIYFVRHGESETNLTRRLTGKFDARLTERGVRQASLCSEYLRSVHFDRLFTSPLARAAETAEILNRYHNLPITPDSRLEEIDAGEWNGRPFDEIERENPTAFHAFQKKPDGFFLPGAETFLQVQNRVLAFCRETAEKVPGETVLVSTHAIPIRCLFAFYTGCPIQKMPWAVNASVSVLTFKDNRLHSKIYSKTDFLGKEITNLSV